MITEEKLIKEVSDSLTREGFTCGYNQNSLVFYNGCYTGFIGSYVNFPDDNDSYIFNVTYSDSTTVLEDKFEYIEESFKSIEEFTDYIKYDVLIYINFNKPKA